MCLSEPSPKAFQLLSKVEGVIPALESSHAIAYAVRNWPRRWGPENPAIVCLSGHWGPKMWYKSRSRLEQERGSKMGKTLTEAFTKSWKTSSKDLCYIFIMGDHELGRFAGNHPIFGKILVSQPLKLAFLFESGGQMALWLKRQDYAV